MGLHLNYTLHLDAATTEADARALLLALQARARTLPMAYVSAVVASREAIAADARSSAHSLARMAQVVSEVDAELEPDAPRSDPDSAIGFFVYPGRGSESADFALMRRVRPDGAPHDWYWRCHCKTQYASLVSDAHLVTCHEALVHLLDAAIELGVRADVHDETQFWETRDTAVLLREVHAMNRVVAAFAGRLGDAIGPQVQAPIFSHPQFEHLEMPGHG